MKKYLLILVLTILTATKSFGANPWYSVNYDNKTVAAMVAAFGTETATEMYYSEQVKEILDRYSAAEVAAAGIFMSKFLDRRALTDLGIWILPDENYYYKRIYSMVASRIMPKIWTVAQLMLHSPQTALYWGSYLFKICAEVESLCMQFESIVTNCSLSFKDIVFLQIAPQYEPLFKLASGGNVDWNKLFDDLGNISNNFTKEKLQADIDNLYQMGVNIAGAGMENMLGALLGGSSFDDIANGNIPAIINAVESSYGFYKSLDSSIGGTLLGMIGGPENVAQLFNIDNYNMTSWITDYIRELQGQYYTQRWYIYRNDSGNEVICNYYPPTDDNSIIYGGEWYRINTTDASFYPNTEQTNAIKANSENYAGWSQAKVNQLNNSQNDYNYSISYSRLSYNISRSGNLYQKSYAYSIRVTRSWNWNDIVYEDIFDSYTMDLNTFQAQLNVILSELNDNEEGYVYRIGSDAKRYYNATDEAKLKGTESVIISVTCHDGFTLMQGTTQYKCSSCGSSLNSHSKDCAMTSSVSASDIDTSDLDRMENELRSQIASLESQISILEAENADLIRQIASATIEETAILRQQYNANKDEIDRLNSQLNSLKRELADVVEAKTQAQEGENIATDDYYRIPAIMADCKTAFNLTWTDEGHWEGYSFVRTATSSGMDAVITFKATLSLARKPKYFLGIKIHRAILQIDWELTADYSGTQVVDVIELDPDMSDRDKTQLVNNRIAEIARDYPNCTITTEYIKNEPVEQDNTNDTFHLLWSSDRLEVARSVDARLTRIYADLVSLEKMMHYKLTIIDVLKSQMPYINDNQGRKLTIIEEGFQRWLENASMALHSSTNPYNNPENTEPIVPVNR